MKILKRYIGAGLLVVSLNSAAAAALAIFATLSTAALVGLASSSGARVSALVGGALVSLGSGFALATVGGVAVGSVVAGAVYGIATTLLNDDPQPVVVAVDNVGGIATNPDLVGSTPPSVTTTPIQGVIGGGGLAGVLAFTGGSCGSGCSGTGADLSGAANIVSLLRTAGYVLSEDFVITRGGYSFNASTACLGITASTYGGTGCTLINYVGTIANPPAPLPSIWTSQGVGLFVSGTSLVMVHKSAYASSCASGSVYRSGFCYVDAVGALNDSVCRVSWNSSALRYDVNPWDPDCTKVKLSTALSTTTTPSSVSFTAADGKTVNVQTATAATQGITSGVGGSRIVETTPDYSNNTTRVATTISTPPTTSSPPVVSGGTSATYPGTGSAVSATALTSVAVANWPTTVNITGTVSCSNCTGTSGGGTVEFPDRIKVDGEIPAAAPLSLPVIQNDEVEGSPTYTFSAMIEPLRLKLAGMLNMTVDPHEFTCPVIDLGTADVFGKSYDFRTNSFCEFAEAQRSLISAFTTVAASILVVLIILTA